MPKIQEIAVDDLRPTQITVGMLEVEEKARRVKELREHPQRLHEYIAQHEIPVVTGYKGHYFLIDHHHLGRAMWEASVKAGIMHLIDDLSRLDKDQFWREMERQRWVHPYDEHGGKCGFEDIPHHLSSLRDDPYRSLAAYVRNEGGYQKTPAPFAEFLWADFFRQHIEAAHLRKHFTDAAERALQLARDRMAAHLPGHIGAAR